MERTDFDNDGPVAEGMFLAWLMALPAGRDPAAAARGAVERLDARGGLEGEMLRLRGLLAVAGRCGAAPVSRGRRGRRH